MGVHGLRGPPMIALLNGNAACCAIQGARIPGRCGRLIGLADIVRPRHRTGEIPPARRGFSRGSTAQQDWRMSLRLRWRSRPLAACGQGGSHFRMQPFVDWLPGPGRSRLRSPGAGLLRESRDRLCISLYAEGSGNGVRISHEGNPVSRACRRQVSRLLRSCRGECARPPGNRRKAGS